MVLQYFLWLKRRFHFASVDKIGVYILNTSIALQSGTHFFRSNPPDNVEVDNKSRLKIIVDAINSTEVLSSSCIVKKFSVKDVNCIKRGS